MYAYANFDIDTLILVHLVFKKLGLHTISKLDKCIIVCLFRVYVGFNSLGHIDIVPMTALSYCCYSRSVMQCRGHVTWHSTPSYYTDTRPIYRCAFCFAKCQTGCHNYHFKNLRCESTDEYPTIYHQQSWYSDHCAAVWFLYN